MTADQLLTELGLAMRLPDLRFDTNGCTRLVVDGTLAVNLEHEGDSGRIHLYGTVAPLPAQGREALYAQLLQANLFGASTGGATLAVDGAHHEVVLCRTVAAEESTPRGFVDAMEKFVAALEDWTARLQAPREAQPAAAEPAAPAFAPFLRA